MLRIKAQGICFVYEITRIITDGIPVMVQVEELAARPPFKEIGRSCKTNTEISKRTQIVRALVNNISCLPDLCPYYIPGMVVAEGSKVAGLIRITQLKSIHNRWF